jgi:hypothetical protein
MRRIDRTCLAEMRSPVRAIMSTIADTVFTIAPEREAEFEMKWGNKEMRNGQRNEKWGQISQRNEKWK